MLRFALPFPEGAPLGSRTRGGVRVTELVQRAWGYTPFGVESGTPPPLLFFFGSDQDELA